MLGVAAYLITLWWRYRGGRQLLLSLPLQNWPDFRKWDQCNEFKLDEAAALWFDAEPRTPMWWRARWKLRRLRNALAAHLTGSQTQPLTAAVGVGQNPPTLARRFVGTPSGCWRKRRASILYFYVQNIVSGRATAIRKRTRSAS